MVKTQIFAFLPDGLIPETPEKIDIINFEIMNVKSWRTKWFKSFDDMKVEYEKPCFKEHPQKVWKADVIINSDNHFFIQDPSPALFLNQEVSR